MGETASTENTAGLNRGSEAFPMAMALKLTSLNCIRAMDMSMVCEPIILSGMSRRELSRTRAPMDASWENVPAVITTELALKYQTSSREILREHTFTWLLRSTRSGTAVM